MYLNKLKVLQSASYPQDRHPGKVILNYNPGELFTLHYNRGFEGVVSLEEVEGKPYVYLRPRIHGEDLYDEDIEIERYSLGILERDTNVEMMDIIKGIVVGTECKAGDFYKYMQGGLI